MRHSELRHTVAVLRNVIGEKKESFAALVGCSPATIESIEANTGRLKLSRSLAERIALETDVDLNWLLANDTKKPIINNLGKPYTKEMYLELRAAAQDGNVPPEEQVEHVGSNVVLVLAHMLGMYVDAVKSGKFQLFNFRLGQTLRDLKAEMGLSAKAAIEVFSSRMDGWKPGDDLERFDAQKLADAFWSEMLAAYKVEPEVNQARTAKRPKLNRPAQPRSSGRRGK